MPSARWLLARRSGPARGPAAGGHPLPLRSGQGTSWPPPCDRKRQPASKRICSVAAARAGLPGIAPATYLVGATAAWIGVHAAFAIYLLTRLFYITPPAPSVPIPKFASLCSTLECELRNQRNTSNVNPF